MNDGNDYLLKISSIKFEVRWHRMKHYYDMISNRWTKAKHYDYFLWNIIKHHDKTFQFVRNFVFHCKWQFIFSSFFLIRQVPSWVVVFTTLQTCSINKYIFIFFKCSIVLVFYRVREHITMFHSVSICFKLNIMILLNIRSYQVLLVFLRVL